MQHLDDGTLQAWLDGPRSGLDASELAEIERHLTGCEACARRLSELEDVSQEVAGLFAGSTAESEPMPEYEAILNRAQGRAPVPRRRSRWATAAWAASIAAAVGTGWLARDLYHGGGATARPAAERPEVASAPAAATEEGTQAPAAGDEASKVASASDKAPSTQDSTAAADARTPVARPATPVLVAAKPALDTAAPPTPVEPLPPPAVSATAERARMSDVKIAPTTFEDRPAQAVRADSAPEGRVVLRGRVTDESGRPLAAAQVVVRGTNVGALTDADGTFRMSLDSLPADSASRSVTVMAQLIGYDGASRTLSTRSGEAVTTDFRLVPQEVALNEIVVTGAAGAPKRPAAERELPRQPMLEVPSGDRTDASWRAVTRSDAETAVGFTLLTVPDLQVVRVEVHDTAGTVLARVVQKLEGGGELELVEARRPLTFDAPATEGRAHASTQRGDVFVIASAPVDPERLQALLSRVR